MDLGLQEIEQELSQFEDEEYTFRLEANLRCSKEAFSHRRQEHRRTGQVVQRAPAASG